MNKSPALLAKCLPQELADEAKFDEPWQAHVFALVVKLSTEGCFTWAEWVDCFSKEVAAATDAEARGLPTPSYYEQWLSAAERMMVTKGLVSGEQLKARTFALAAVGAGHLFTAQ